MVKKFNNKIHRIIMLLMLIVFIFILTTIFNNHSNAYAIDGNKVFFKDVVVETNESSLIIAEIFVEGQTGDTVEFSYHTEGATAIQGIDYNATSRSVSFIIPSSGSISHKISIKCLNDNDNRKKLRIYDNDNEYGRYFNLIIDNATNATIDTEKDVCKCYLSYNYRVSATTGIKDSYNVETAYLKDYETMQYKYHKGKDDIDGGETWKTWDNGVSFNNDTSKRWTNAFINEGLAKAYTSFMAEEMDDATIGSNGQIKVLAGGKEMIDRYERKVDCPGMYLYLAIVPCWMGYGIRLDSNAMKEIDKGNDPYDYDSDLVHVTERHKHSESKIIYWIQDGNSWYASNRSLVNSTFYEISPYNGILDSGVAFHNDNSELDRYVKNIYLFLSLVDDKTP